MFNIFEREKKKGEIGTGTGGGWGVRKTHCPVKASQGLAGVWQGVGEKQEELQRGIYGTYI